MSAPIRGEERPTTRCCTRRDGRGGHRCRRAVAAVRAQPRHSVEAARERSPPMGNAAGSADASVASSPPMAPGIGGSNIDLPPPRKLRRSKATSPSRSSGASCRSIPISSRRRRSRPRRKSAVPWLGRLSFVLVSRRWRPSASRWLTLPGGDFREHAQAGQAASRHGGAAARRPRARGDAAGAPRRREPERLRQRADAARAFRSMTPPAGKR